ncbi:MAG: zf-HC2 domain-containing protein [Gemmatimonadetes bacterium]|nr:zf-HC2 domain-containing protein [Gemmatimonadota bacterium]
MNTVPSRLECEEVVVRLWPHLDGTLPETERERVIAHLQECAGCRSHYDFARAFLVAVDRAGREGSEFAALRERVNRAVAASRR